MENDRQAQNQNLLWNCVDERVDNDADFARFRLKHPAIKFQIYVQLATTSDPSIQLSL